jgi:hypothetical protein
MNKCATIVGISRAPIYFAVRASYEQQVVNANQQALTAAVQQYRTACAKKEGMGKGGRGEGGKRR